MIRPLLRKNFRDLIAMKVQVASAALLICCGVALLVASLSAWEGLLKTQRRYYSEYRFGHLFGSIKRAPLERVRRLERIAGVDEVEARISSRGILRIVPPETAGYHPSLERSDPANVLLLSVPSSDQPALNRLKILEGHLPAHGLTSEVCVHVAFAEAHGLKPGAEVELQVENTRERMRVSCIAISPEFVYALSPEAPLPDDEHFGVVWIPRETLEPMAGMAGSFNSFSLRVQSGSESRVKLEVEEQLALEAVRAVNTRKTQLSNRFVEDEIRQQRITAVFFPSIFLGVAGFLIHVMISRMITLQRSQIGTLKAMGYRDQELAIHYLVFGVSLPVLGIPPGILLGVGVGRLLSGSYQRFFRFPEFGFELSALAVGMALVMGTIPGLLGSLMSARRVMNLRPAEAMRPAAPGRESGDHLHLWRERFIHATQKGSVIPRLVIRNILGRPARLGMTVMALSFSVSLLVMARSWDDMIQSLLRTQFGLIQKEDMSVLFVRPVRESALQELRAMKGILEVSGARTVGIRIRYQNHSREIPLTGWSDQPSLREMSRTARGESRPAGRLEDGVVLSRYFQDQWGLHSGDRVEIQRIDLGVSEFSVRVLGFTDDRVGLSGNTSYETLSRWLGELPVWSEAHLRVDPQMQREIQLKLREMPLVGAVFLKSAWLKGFRSTVGEIVRVSTWMLTGFALSISVGILLNSIRVSFSERVWELSSLRVLGVDRGTVFGVFWAEVMAQVVLSLLPGCVAGRWLVGLSMKAIHTESIGFPVIIFGSTYARAVLVVLLAMTVMGFGAWRRIARMNLTEALKARD